MIDLRYALRIAMGVFLCIVAVSTLTYAIADAASENYAGLSEDISWFFDPPVTRTSDYYQDRVVHCSTPENLEKLRVTFGFDDADILLLQQHCITESSFRIRGATVPEELNLCTQQLFQVLDPQTDRRIDPEILMDECILRIEFENTFPQREQSELDILYARRDAELTRDLNFVPRMYNKETGEIIDRNDLVPKNRFEERINPGYYRNESNDLENARAALEAKNASAIADIDADVRGDEPVIDIAGPEEADYRGILRKVTGLMSWFGKWFLDN